MRDEIEAKVREAFGFADVKEAKSKKQQPKEKKNDKADDEKRGK